MRSCGLCCLLACETQRLTPPLGHAGCTSDSALPKHLLSLRRRLPVIAGQELEDLRVALPGFEAQLIAEATAIKRVRCLWCCAAALAPCCTHR